MVDPGALAAWLGGKLLVPLVSWICRRIGREAPAWQMRLKRFARIKHIESRVGANEKKILGHIQGKQRNYESIQLTMAGILEGESLLQAVTELQVLGLLNEPRLYHPPHPQALFTLSNDADMLLARSKVERRPKPRDKDMAEAARRRERLAGNVQWLEQRGLGTVKRIAVHGTKAVERKREADEDAAWLKNHGF